jgi:four helix bundle protein
VSNIAEGQGRNTPRDFDHFLGTAKGSLLEVETQLLIAKNLGYISERNFKDLMTDYDEISRLISGLKLALSKKAGT